MHFNPSPTNSQSEIAEQSDLVGPGDRVDGLSLNDVEAFRAEIS